MQTGHVTVPCPECGFDGRGLSPADAAVALRSLPRRFREAAEPVEEVAGPSVDAAAVLAAAGQAADAIGELGEDLRRVLVEDDPALSTSGAEATAVRHGGDPATALERLAAAATTVADLISAQPADAWTRTGVRSDGPVTAADLAREAVHAGVHRLRAVEQQP
jgi:hypothetical protein